MRILVAMSGGVDSAVVAALLAEQGHDVIGATLQLYDHGAAIQKKGACCAGQDILDARRVADRIGIPHYVLDREARFHDAVVQTFADSYAAGETPVPCVSCNQTVKFQDLTELARDLGCEALATGHYVRRVEGPEGPELHRARDPARDQSWFLFATTREQLAFARFPLGDMPDKAAVRAEAERLGLPVAEKPDSQDICFVPRGRYHEVVARLRPETAEPGEIVDESGQVLGQHGGIGRYTVGQGRGLGAARKPGEEPVYVAGIDAPRRRLVVSHRAGLLRRTVWAERMNWLVEPPAAPLRCTVKLRARDQASPAAVHWHPAEGVIEVVLDEAGIAAPGQGCVLYQGNRVLGGGFLRSAIDRTGAAA